MADVDLYSSYVELKGWSEDDKDGYTEYDSWFAPLLAPGAKLLDIGFGDGTLLRWARRSGCDAAGVEIIPELLQRAASQGFAVHKRTQEIDETFDVVCAMDVFEHLTVNDLAAMLEECRRLLKPGGILVAKFPNGASPFSGYYQASDATHLKALAPRALAQIAVRAGLKVAKVFNPRSWPPSRLPGRVKRALKYKMRNLVERLYCALYFGTRFPIDPNVVVVLRAR